MNHRSHPLESAARLLRHPGLLYATVFVATMAGAYQFLGPNAFSVEGVWSAWGDLIWFQGMSQIASQNGILGLSPNLGWPDGVSVWSHPQSGLLLLGLFWFFGGVVGASSAASLSWSLAAVAATNATAVLYFLRGISARTSLIPIMGALALSLGLSPFVLLNMGQLNVATFFVLPLLLGVFLRMRDLHSLKPLVLFGVTVAAAAVVSPLWWVVVALFLSGIIGVFSLFSRQWKLGASSGVVILGTLVGFAVQSLLFFSAPITTAVTRGPWDSNVYGGRALDILFASPALNHLIPELELLRPGASVELWQVGLVGGTLAALAIVSFLVVLFRNTASEPRVWILASVSVVTTLLFVSGGFGNLQAGVLHLLGVDSPARVWSRLVVLLAVIGAGFLLLGVERLSEVSNRQRGNQLRIVAGVLEKVAIPLIVLGLMVPDYLVTRNSSSPIPFSELEEYGAVEYLDSQGIDDCPVLQLPVESMPLPLSGVADYWSDSYYRGLIPYLMKPELPWSFGDHSREDRAAYLNDLGPEMSGQALAAITDAGFCFVLFDKKLAQISEEYGVELPGARLNGAFGTPIFDSERFEVYAVSADKLLSLSALPISESIDFSEDGNSRRYASGGLWETESSHTWASAEDVTLTLQLEPVPQRPVTVVLSARSFLPPDEIANTLTVSVGNEVIAKLSIEGTPEDYRFQIPVDYLTTKPLTLKFAFEFATQPCFVSESGDCRNLSVAFQSISFR
jgi:hypothetical protein